MKYHPEFFKDSGVFLYFTYPDKIIVDATVFKIKNSTSNLMIKLKNENIHISDIFDLQEYEHKVDKLTMYFHRRKLVVKKTNDFMLLQQCIKLLQYEYDSCIRKCPICNNNYYILLAQQFNHRGTCDNKLCITQNKSNVGNSIKNNHWHKSSNADEIDAKRVQTRLKNDSELNRVYVPWNKGKTGIYSEETIEKIREASRKQFFEEKIKKTKIEQKFENFLIDNNISYKYSFIVDKRQFDFVIFCKKQNILIELQGDFWHGNPKFWGKLEEGFKYELREHQKMKQLDDAIKRRIAFETGYDFLVFWENDIYYKFDEIEQITLSKIDVLNNV
jgi:hypothetical protein